MGLIVEYTADPPSLIIPSPQLGGGCPLWKEVDDRVQVLQEMKSRLEARVMHGLIGTDITCKDLLDAHRGGIKVGTTRADGDLE